MKGLGPHWGGLSLACAAAVLLALAAGALAAPKHGASYTGRGPDYMNNNTKWTREATGHVSFKASSDGADVLNFKGTYSYYCGAGTSSITDPKIHIAKGGSFSARGHHVEKLHGVVEGTHYLSVSGRFNKSGTTAKVSYLDDFVYAGKHVKHPYSTKMKSATDACESWVRATAHPKTG